MNAHLKRLNAFLFISFHRLNSRYNPDRDITDHSHITLLDPGYDLYPDLALFDTLITDYSSIFTDFVLLDKPIYFFVPDLEHYKSTGLLREAFEERVPGPLARTTDELIEALEKKDEWQTERREAKKLFFTHTDGRATERIARSLVHF